MEAPLVEDTTYIFFLRDTTRRLGRLVELACAYGGFILLLYCRLLTPGGQGIWTWFELNVFWVAVFSPLYFMDYRNFQHAKYLQVNRDYFSTHESLRYYVISASECSYKVLLCLYLVVKPLRSTMSLKWTVMPYAVGYILHFVLGHFLPLEDRPEGCNAISALMSELGRFLSFVLVISLSLKVDKVSSVEYNWQAAFWPCWGLEGLVILVVVLVVPVCLVSAVLDRSRLLMLTWVLIAMSGLGVASFLTMINVSNALDNNLCDALENTAAENTIECRQMLELAMWPWLAFLPAFALGTMLLKRRLAAELHDAWYQSGSPNRGPAASQAPPAPVEELPIPAVMFRVTPTYYSRACLTSMLDSDGIGNSSGPSVLAQPSVQMAAPSSMGSVSRTYLGSMASRVQIVDPSTSILSARGATFTDVVENEQLCYICYDAPPAAILLECGHAGLCVDCGSGLLQRRVGHSEAHCPICRSSVTCVLRVRPGSAVPPGLFSVRGRADHVNGRSWRSCGDESRGSGVPSAGSNSILLPAAEEDTVPGPPWPFAAKRHAVVVEAIVRARNPRAAGRGILPYFLQ